MTNTEKNYKLAIQRFEQRKDAVSVFDYYSNLSGSNQKMFLAAVKKNKYFGEEIIKILSSMKKNECEVKSFKAYTLEEIKLIIAKVEKMELKYQAIVMTQLETGCRRFEIVKIWQEFKLNPSKVVWIYGKGDKKGKIFISNKLFDVLTQWVASDSYKEYSNEQISNIVVDALASCGLKGNTHDLRRAFATNLRKHFVPLEQIQLLLRHSDLETTIGYIKITDEEIFNVLENKYLNVDELVNENNFREKYLELLQMNMRMAERIRELEDGK